MLEIKMKGIYKNHHQMMICGAVLTGLAFSAFVLASLNSFIYFMNHPVKRKDEDAANKERLQKITKH